jgi:hypothetical protein
MNYKCHDRKFRDGFSRPIFLQKCVAARRRGHCTRRIVSQWGTYPVYEHAVFEVPTGYGDNVRYFKMIDSAEGLLLFRTYAKAAGLTD